MITGLVDDGYTMITALDISSSALGRLVAALGSDASKVRTVVSDVCEFVADEPCAVWHDRATFHFLTTAEQQEAYVARASAAIEPGGHLVLAGFAPDGPVQCSGLDVARHSLDDVATIFGSDFEIVEHAEVDHVTPWDSTQRFLHVLLRKS